MVHVFRSCFSLRSIFAAVSAVVAVDAQYMFCHDAASAVAAVNAGQCLVDISDICEIASEAYCTETDLLVILRNGSRATWQTMADKYLRDDLVSLNISIVPSIPPQSRFKKLDGEGFRKFAKALPTTLKSLDVRLEVTQLTTKKAKALLNAIDKMPNLETLVLDFAETNVTNGAIKKLARVLPETLGTMQLNVYRSQWKQDRISDEGIKDLAGAFESGVPNLRTLELNLGRTDVTNTGIESVTFALRDQLDTLVLKAHGISGADRSILSVFDALSNRWTNLVVLRLDFGGRANGKVNNVTDACIDAIALKVDLAKAWPDHHLRGLFLDLQGNKAVTKDSLKRLQAKFMEFNTWDQVIVSVDKNSKGLRARRTGDDDWDGGNFRRLSSATSSASASWITAPSSAHQIATAQTPTLTVYP